MKKIYKVGIYSILGLLMFSTVQNVSANEIFEGTVHNELVGIFSRNDTSKQTIFTMKEIAKENPDINVIISDSSITVTENIGLSENANLKIQGKSVPIKNGKFVIPSSVKSTEIKYTISDDGTDTTSGTIKNDENLNIVNKIDYNSMIDSMDEMNNQVQTSNNGLSLIKASAHYGGQKDGQYVKRGVHVHCNRFNGTYSNHRYYSRLKAQGWVNYIGSDCWYKHKAYKCPFTKPDRKCDGLLKKGAHDCSIKGHWPVTMWYRN